MDFAANCCLFGGEGTNVEKVVGFVREAGITEKAFMRLTEGDLTSLSENPKQSVLPRRDRFVNAPCVVGFSGHRP
ncbi:hypothetical protein D9613_012041 [Agrocybe pediades]|uniref:Uncharacterized protein n=1 Tax=Agrocybe pediades TaxID=84607 RepID=A0A8H4QF68_9AGAR|nr:hypothetical protein D9613_012041 [Agrocybe pediades]